MKTLHCVGLLVVAALVQTPVHAVAQSLGYLDADTPSEAVGMMKSSMYTAEFLKRECSARFLDQAGQIEADLTRWKATEARALERADHYWAEMAAKEPKLPEMLARAETYLKESLKLLEQFDPARRSHVFSQYCRQYFADLASGVWRRRTPRLYEFLDRAP